jgi:hypothetical protein
LSVFGNSLYQAVQTRFAVLAMPSNKDFLKTPGNKLRPQAIELATAYSQPRCGFSKLEQSFCHINQLAF